MIKTKSPSTTRACRVEKCNEQLNITAIIFQGMNIFQALFSRKHPWNYLELQFFGQASAWLANVDWDVALKLGLQPPFRCSLEKSKTWYLKQQNGYVVQKNVRYRHEKIPIKKITSQISQRTSWNHNFTKKMHINIPKITFANSIDQLTSSNHP